MSGDCLTGLTNYCGAAWIALRLECLIVLSQARLTSIEI